MKHLKNIFTISVVAALGTLVALSTACKKSSSPTTTTTTTTTGSNPTPSMSASYSTGFYSGVGNFTNVSGFSYPNNIYGIQGSIMGSGNQPFTLFINATIVGTGTFALGQGSGPAGSGNYADFIQDTCVTNPYKADFETGYPLSNPGSGTLTITSFNSSTRRISGQFGFTGGTSTQSSPSTTITTGVFSNVSY